MGVPFRSQLAGLCTLAVSLTAHAEAPAPSATEPLPDAAKPALPALPKLPPVPKKFSECVGERDCIPGSSQACARGMQSCNFMCYWDACK